jgi:ubiquinone/menaquinone biosynthesis C-methylase UbiE
MVNLYGSELLGTGLAGDLFSCDTVTVVSNDIAHRRPLFRLALFLVCAILIFLALNTLYSFTSTLNQLDRVESERDQWQRPSDVLRALDLRSGNTVVDLGSGSGYFALKLSPAVGERGQVLAVDLRRLSLFFLWTRALLRGQYNVQVIVGQENNPRLPAGTVDAVLICNTYHEFSDPELILDRVFRSLRPGGRLVVVDRAPRATEAQHTHEVPLTAVERELRNKGFEIVSQDDSFIDRPGDDLWWLVTARKP